MHSSTASDNSGGWLDRLAAKKDRSDAAVKAVLLAANETKAYIVDWSAGSRARDRELVLVRLRGTSW